MKIGMTGLPRYGEDKYKKLKEYGFDCIDFGLAETDTVFYMLPEAESDTLLLKHKALAEASGVEINQVHGPWRYPPMDSTPEERAERFEKMSRSIRATALLGCKYWVIHPIMPFGTHDLEIGKEKETWELNLEFFRALLPVAKEHGVTICFENMPMLNFSMAKPVDILRFVEEMGDENFKVCLDTGHVTVFKELSIGEETRRLGKHIKVLHVHDNRMSLDMHLFPYLGKTNWDDFLAALKEVGYNGVFSLETEPPAAYPDHAFDLMCTAMAEVAKSMADKID